MRAQLIPLDGSPLVEITKDLVLVGRKEECDLRLDHKSVSKYHCVLVKTDGLLLLRDLGSTNGTRVNGKRVRRAALLPNDQLHIANCGFRVYLGPDHLPDIPDELTQELNSVDLARLRDSGESEVMPDSEKEIDLRVDINSLPDAYSSDEQNKDA
jgi:pSer/pThr/pTyr-binding forkhead associated (FHA) protein